MTLYTKGTTKGLYHLTEICLIKITSSMHRPTFSSEQMIERNTVQNADVWLKHFVEPRHITENPSTNEGALTFQKLLNLFGVFGAKKAKSTVLLKHQQIIIAISMLAACLLLIYLLLFISLQYKAVDDLSKFILVLPFTLSLVQLFAAWKNKTDWAMFIITWLMPSVMGLTALISPGVNYSKLILIYMLATLFLNYSKQKRLIGFIFLTLIYLWIQLQHYNWQSEGHVPEIITLEVIMMPVFCVVIFIIFSRIKNEFTVYQREVRQQKLLIEKKKIHFEALFRFSEQQRNKLMQTVLLKERLISVISHDVRLPINSFRFLIENYEKGYWSEKMLVEGILETKHELIKVDEMVQDLAKWATSEKPDTKAKHINEKRLHEVVDSVCAVSSLSARNKNLEVLTEIHLPENMCLAIPRREMEIIIRNLLSNAIKFSHIRSRIRINIEPLQESLSSIAVLTVKDFGKGITPSILARLNNRLSVSTLGTIDEVGLGIGLSIVFDIINNYGLHYNIESIPAKGTSFSVHFPMISSKSYEEVHNNPM